MTAAPVFRAALGGLFRRRLVQTLVIFVVLAAATAAATLGLSLLTSANEAFLNGFATHRGADVSVTIDSARVTRAQLAATGRVPGVTQVAGPYPEVTVNLRTSGAPSAVRRRPGPGSRASGSASGPSPGRGISFDQMATVGRASPGGPLDDIILYGGHWPTGPGQVAVAIYTGFAPPIGSKVTVTSAPGKPQLTVVGYAGSSARYGDAWVTPSQAAALREPGSPAMAQMLFTFSHAGSAQQIGADIAALKAALPAGAIAGYQSWLGSANQTHSESSFSVPFVVAFAVLALVVAVLIVANVVSAAVVAAYRRIGVLKSIGFTPAQVTTAYIGQVGAPALVGCVAGTILGNLWVAPLLNGGGGLFRVGTQHVPLWVNITVPLGMCVLAGLAALVPALRAGLLSAVQAIAAGQAPRQGHGYTAHRLAGRLRLPRPVTIGLAAPFARPARTAATAAAIMLGVTAVILGVGLSASLAKAVQVTGLGTGQLSVAPASGNAGRAQDLTASQALKAAAAALRAQPGTARYVAEADGGGTGLPGQRFTVGVTGVQALGVTAYDGESSWLGWNMISGRWYHGPGEADVNTAFLRKTGLSVGGRVTLTVKGKPVTVRIVGQVFSPTLPFLWTSWQTLGGKAAGLSVSAYDVGLRPGANLHAYETALSRDLGHGFSVQSAQPKISLGTAPSLIPLLTLMVAVLAGLGVLNSVLMVTRERVHDLGIFKAVGMTPRQTIAMVICWVIAPAVAATVIAVPAAIILHSVTVQAIGHEAGTGIPASILAVYHPAQLLLLALSGLAIAAAGALLPAGWAAASRTTTALRAE